MSFFSSAPKRSQSVAGSSSKTRVKPPSRMALSMNINKDRTPVIAMNATDDVATLVCTEISRMILIAPDVNLGNFFRLTSASRENINKSDAVIAMSAAILDSIGHKKASASMLKLSLTVARFYDSLNLNNELIRNSFVILLFALAPEFVKMVEASVSLAVDRASLVTSAPESGHRVIHALGALAKSDEISLAEHKELMMNSRAIDNIRTSLTDSTRESAANSVCSPTSIGFDDSISMRGSNSKLKYDDMRSTRNLMQYIRGNKDRLFDNIDMSSYTNSRAFDKKESMSRRGLGYAKAESAADTMLSESTAIPLMTSGDTNDTAKRQKHEALMAKKMQYEANKALAELNLAEKKLRHMRRRDTMIDNNFESYTNPVAEVTMDDIRASKIGKKPDDLGLSLAELDLDGDNDSLLDLL